MSARWPIDFKIRICKAAKKLKEQGKPLADLAKRFPGQQIPPDQTVRCWLRDFLPGFEKNPGGKAQKWPEELMARVCAAYELVKDTIPMTEFAKQFYNHPSRTTIDNRYRGWWPEFKEANPALVRRLLRPPKQLFQSGQSPIALLVPAPLRRKRPLTQRQLDKMAKDLRRAGGLVERTVGALGRRRS